MRISTGSISYTTVAAGVTRFAWHAPHDQGDGLLVDMAVAKQWCDVADVLLWPAPVDPTIAAAHAARSQAALAIIAQRPAHWIIFMHPALAVRAVTHQAVVCAADQTAMLEVVVERYRAIIAEHDQRR
jgi:hypothetical protein